MHMPCGIGWDGDGRVGQVEILQRNVLCFKLIGFPFQFEDVAGTYIGERERREVWLCFEMIIINGNGQECSGPRAKCVKVGKIFPVGSNNN